MPENIQTLHFDEVYVEILLYRLYIQNLTKKVTFYNYSLNSKYV